MPCTVYSFSYLERNFYKSEDPLALAIVTYVFTLSSSSQTEAAFAILDSKKIEEGIFFFFFFAKSLKVIA